MLGLKWICAHNDPWHWFNVLKRLQWCILLQTAGTRSTAKAIWSSIWIPSMKMKLMRNRVILLGFPISLKPYISTEMSQTNQTIISYGTIRYPTHTLVLTRERCMVDKISVTVISGYISNNLTAYSPVSGASLSPKSTTAFGMLLHNAEKSILSTDMSTRQIHGA